MRTRPELRDNIESASAICLVQTALAAVTMMLWLVFDSNEFFRIWAQINVTLAGGFIMGTLTLIVLNWLIPEHEYDDDPSSEA